MWEIGSSMKSFHRLNASYNFYMYEGGSNFGYWPSLLVTQSYDYAAPLTEAGNYSYSYYPLRTLIKNLTGRSIPSPPPPPLAASYGTVNLRNMGSVFQLLPKMAPVSTPALYPQTSEELGQAYGFVLYTTKIPKGGNNVMLSVPGVKDRAQVMVNDRIAGTVCSITIGSQPAKTTIAISASPGDTLALLVENLGRDANGTILDHKGLIANVTYAGMTLTHWEQYPLTLKNVLPQAHSQYEEDGWTEREELDDTEVMEGRGELEGMSVMLDNDNFIPTMYQGTFNVPTPTDTYFDPSGWGKGQVLINGFNLGRYWPTMGPQITLYVPKGILRKGSNTLTLFELERPGCSGSSCTARFGTTSLLNSTVH